MIARGGLHGRKLAPPAVHPAQGLRGRSALVERLEMVANSEKDIQRAILRDRHTPTPQVGGQPEMSGA